MQRHIKRPADQIAGAGGMLELEVIVTDDGLALLPSEVDLLGTLRAEVADPEAPRMDKTGLAALERLGRLTARALEHLAGERLDPHDAADRAWLIVTGELEEYGTTTDRLPSELAAAVSAFRELDAYAQAYDERVEHRDEELEHLRDVNVSNAAAIGRLDRLIATVLDGARLAGGADAFEGRYEALGVALKGLEEQARKP